jgi:hypothetical protein
LDTEDAELACLNVQQKNSYPSVSINSMAQCDFVIATREVLFSGDEPALLKPASQRPSPTEGDGLLFSEPS